MAGITSRSGVVTAGVGRMISGSFGGGDFSWELIQLWVSNTAWLTLVLGCQLSSWFEVLI